MTTAGVQSAELAIGRAANASDGHLDSRFGVDAGGLGLLLNAAQGAEFLAGIKIFPIPRVGRRVRGAAQIRGHPVLVFCVNPVAPSTVAVVQTCSIVMLKGRDSLLAMQVEQAPLLLNDLQVVDAALPDSCYSGCLMSPRKARVVGTSAQTDFDARIWWESDFDRFFEALAHD
jgi:hypothetical protein